MTQDSTRNRTLSLVAWLGILMLGALLRWLGLGAAPLFPAEVNEALTALLGPDRAWSAVSGLMAGVNHFLFWMFGPGDGVARLLPALCGGLLPLLMLLFRPWLGRVGAWAAGALLALSPSLVLFSRTASGVAPGVAAALLLLAALMHMQDESRPVWQLLAGAACGLGLAAGSAFISLALALLIAWLLAGMRPQEPVRWGPLVGAMLGVLLLSSTALLFFPAGLGVVADGLSVWLAGFDLQLGELGRTLGIVLLYEPLVWLPAIPGVVLLARGQSRWQRFLGIWLLMGVVFALLRPGQVDSVFGLLVPLVCAAASFFDELSARLTETDREYRTSMLAASVLGVAALWFHAWLSLGQYAHLAALNDTERAAASLMLFGISLILMAGVLALLWTFSRRLAWHSLVLALTLVLSLYGWGRAWELGHTHRTDPRELWIDAAPAPGLPVLVETLQTTSHRVTGSTVDLPLTVQSDSATLRWALRDFDVQWVDELQPLIISEAVLTPFEENPLLGDSYLGTDFSLMWRESTSLAAVPLPADHLRWWLTRDAPLPEQTEKVILWVRQDVAPTGDTELMDNQ